MSVRFARWLDGISLISRHITVPPGSHVQQAGFVVSRPISLRFADEKGRPVPVPSVGQITVTNGVGERFTFRPARPPRLLPVNRIVRGAGGLEPLALRYSLRSAMIDGSNVVFGGSQKFFIREHLRPWNIKVLLFPLRIQVRDALFKFNIGSAVRITFPNGTSRVVRLGPGHSATVAGLPRGTYLLRSQGPGLGFSTPVALSAAQSADLLLLSWADVLTVAVFAAAFLIGLPLAGGRIARRAGGPGGGHRLGWQADPEREPLSSAGHGTLLESAADDRHAGTGSARPGMARDVLAGTSVMPAITDVAGQADRPRGKRRRA